MSLIVQKFGGSSVRDAQRIRNVAGIIAETYLEGNDVLVVLSAQGDTTDDLIAKAEEINSHPSKREMDMLLSTGEQISVALCAMALESMGLPCVSLTAWQVGIQTTAVHGDARIKRIDSERVQAELDQHRIVLITGFQGMDRAGDPGPGRQRHQCCGAGGGVPGQTVPDLHGCGRCLHCGPPDRAKRQTSGRDHL